MHWLGLINADPKQGPSKEVRWRVREADAGTKDALVGFYMLANSRAAGVQQPQPARQHRHPQPALLNGLNLRPLQTERPFSKSSHPAETEKVREYQATMLEVGKQRREAMGSTSASDVPDYCSVPWSSTLYGRGKFFREIFCRKAHTWRHKAAFSCGAYHPGLYFVLVHILLHLSRWRKEF